MILELRVLSGARAGQSQRFEKSVIALGRHPLSDFRLDAERDLDVSARHAEIRGLDGTYVLRDAGSTNGTYVNGARIDGERRLQSGDVITLGELGPQLRVEMLSGGLVPPASPPSAPPAAPRESHGSGAARRASAAPILPPSTETKIRVAVQTQTRSLQRMLTALATVLVICLVVAIMLVRREQRQRDFAYGQISRQMDSLRHSYDTTSVKLLAVSSLFSQKLRETDSLRAALETAHRTGSESEMIRVRTALDRAQRLANGIRAVDYTRIFEANRAAIVLVAVMWPDGTSITGTGFCVTRDGAIITNKHVLQNAQGESPKKILVLFGDTRGWLPAHPGQMSPDADLGVLQVEGADAHPVVSGIARSSAATPVGSPIAIIGYPLGMDTPMEGSGTSVTARSSLDPGLVSKQIPDVVQLDAFAAPGSSGSPVLNASGAVVGVVYAGQKDAQGHLVYAVPSDRLIALLPPAARSLIR